MKKVWFSAIAGLCLSGMVFGNTSPTVTNVTASPSTNGSGDVVISFWLTDADNDRCTITLQVSNDGGSTWTITPSPSALSGALTNVYPGNRTITWASKVDLPGVFGSNYRVKVTADDSWVWVYINDPGVLGHEPFNGYMSKYETTNAQYCQYLNAAKASGLITVYNADVYAVSDTSHSQIYLELYPGSSSYSQISYNGSTFTVRSRDGYDMSNHPVVEVSWYGATAFASYYGWRLPTEWEWQAVADYNGSYTYGCGTTINQTKANYYDNGYANPLGLSSYPYTSPVGYYPAYGYGLCDMAGNAWEWTSSCYYEDCDPDYRVIRGGGWTYYGGYCAVSYRSDHYPGVMYTGFGFRVCR